MFVVVWDQFTAEIAHSSLARAPHKVATLGFKEPKKISKRSKVEENYYHVTQEYIFFISIPLPRGDMNPRENIYPRSYIGFSFKEPGVEIYELKTLSRVGSTYLPIASDWLLTPV